MKFALHKIDLLVHGSVLRIAMGCVLAGYSSTYAGVDSGAI